MSAAVLGMLQRPMTEDDLAAVMELERAAYPLPWTIGMFRDCLRMADSPAPRTRSSTAGNGVPVSRDDFVRGDFIGRDRGAPRYCCRVAESVQPHRSRPDPELSGYGIISIGGGESQLLNLCVREHQRNRGLAGQLLARLMEIAGGYHADAMFLEVRPSNRSARRLYGRMGFHEIGIRPAYYPGKKGDKAEREDALIMRAALLERVRGTQQK